MKCILTLEVLFTGSVLEKLKAIPTYGLKELIIMLMVRRDCKAKLSTVFQFGAPFIYLQQKNSCLRRILPLRCYAFLDDWGVEFVDCLGE